MYPYHKIYSWEKFTILVVEDDYSSVFYLKEVLKDTGINIEISNDGEHAIELCRINPAINIVLMDIHLPNMNGLDATNEIKKYRPGLPVIAQTAYASPYDIENWWISGCDDYVAKPIDSYDLLEKIDRILLK
jgi:CheY-like chemotaxis protein